MVLLNIIGFFYFVVGFLCLALAVATTAGKTSAQKSEAGWVVLPVHEYESLRARSTPAVHEPEPPPLDATLTRIEYDLKIQHAVASGRADLTIDVLRDGWVRVPIPAGLLVREAKLNGKLVQIAPGTSGAPPSILLARRGRSHVALEIAAAVSASAGEERLVLPVGSSAITRAAVTMGRQDRE